MRHKLLTVVGGNFFYETTTVLQIRGEPIIWLNRDEDGYLLLNIRMLTISGEPRIQVEENFWLARGNLEDLESPPSGKLLHAKYPNGDVLKIQFLELETIAAAEKRYPGAQPSTWRVPFPITAVEVHNKVAGTDIHFGPRQTNLMGIGMQNCFMAYCGAGIAID